MCSERAEFIQGATLYGNTHWAQGHNYFVKRDWHILIRSKISDNHLTVSLFLRFLKFDFKMKIEINTSI